jgi:hypothetical protein
MGKCSRIVNGVEHKLLTEMYDFIENSKPDSRNVDAIMQILDDNRSVVDYRGTKYVNEDQLKDIQLINNEAQKIGGQPFIDTEFFLELTATPVSPATKLYEININEEALRTIPEAKDQNSDGTFNTQYGKEKVIKTLSPKTEQQAAEQEEGPEIAASEETTKVYTTPERSSEALQKLALDAKVIIESELQEINRLPEAEREKKENRLKRLRTAVEKIDRVVDFNMFVTASKDNINNAIEEFNQLMAMPIELRSTPENMNRMYSIKQTIDSMDTILQLEQIALNEQALGKVKGVNQEAFDLLMENIDYTIKQTKRLNNQFQEEVIPMMAEVLVGYHNTTMDPKIQALIDNIETHKRTIGLDTNTSEYKDLVKRKDNGDLTAEQFRDLELKLNVEQLKNKQILGRDAMIKELREAHKDKSGFSYLFDPLIYSSDPAIQLFTKSVKEATFETNRMTLDYKYDLKEEYDLFTEGMSESDIAKLNDDLLEEVTMTQYDADGNPKEVKVLAFVSPIDKAKYEESKKQMYEAAGRRYNLPNWRDYKNGKQDSKYQSDIERWNKDNKHRRDRIGYSKAVNDWHKENTEPVEGWQQQREKIKSQIASAERTKRAAIAAGRSDSAHMAEEQIKALREKLRKNLLDGQPRNEWVKPKESKYANSKYKQLQANPKKKRYYDFMLKSFQEGQKMVGVNRFQKEKWEDFSYILPSVRKVEYDRLKEQGGISATKDILAESFTIQDTDIEFGRYNAKTGELQKSVPVFYNNLVESKDVSKDIASSMYAFRHMTHNFQSKSKILGQVMLFREILQNRDTLLVNSSGVEMLSKVASDLGVKLPMKKDGESYNFKHVNEFIDTIMFGERQLKANFTLGGKTLSGTKIADSINAFTAINTLSFNFLQGANQSILDNMALVSEGAAGEFFSTADLAWAKSQYWSEGAGLSDVGKFAPDTKLGKALEMFDALTEFTDQEGNRLVGSRLRKAMQTGNFLIVQQAAEHEVAATRMLALMKNLEGKLKDKDGNVITKEDGSPANLYDMLLIDDKGKMSLDPRVANFSESDFINLIQGLSRRTNQTKGGFDRATLQRRWYGKLAMLFRSWLLPGLRRRYGHGGFTGSTVHTDEELGTVTQGMYISFYNMLRESFMGKTWPTSVYKTMSEMEQRNVKRTAVELGSLAAASVLVAALANLDDDEETWVTNFVMYQALRYQAEIKQWTPVYGYREAFRIAKSPTATARQIEKVFSLTDQIFFKEIPYLLGVPMDEKNIYYQRSTGRYKKGDRKIRKDVDDLMPIIRGLRKSQTPEEAAKYFLGLGS